MQSVFLRDIINDYMHVSPTRQGLFAGVYMCDLSLDTQDLAK